MKAASSNDSEQTGTISDDVPSEPRFGIVSKIQLAGAFVITASLVGFVLVATGLQQASDRMSVVTRHHMPVLMRAAELLSESDRLVSHAADILSVRTNMVRDELATQITIGVEEKRRLIKELRILNPGLPDLNGMDSSFESLAANLKDLAGLAAQRIELQQGIMEQMEHLRRLSVEIERLEAEPHGSTCLSAWKHHAQRALVELMSAAAAQDSAQIERRRRDYFRMLVAMGGSLDCLGNRVSPDILRLHRYIATPHGAREIFSMRLSELELALNLENRLIWSGNISESLMHSVDDLFRHVQRDTYNRNREIEQGLSARLGMLVVISLLLLLICVGVWFYLRRAFLEPILGLRHAMDIQLRGGNATYPRPKRDELGMVITEVKKAIDSLKTRECELLLAKAEVERVSNAKSLFLAHVNHELRTPLHSILGYAGVLQRRVSLMPELVKPCSVILHSGKHLLELIDDLLDLAAIESGSVQLSIRELDISAFLNALHDIIQPQAKAKELSFHIDKGSQLPVSVFADSKHLQQILLNLLTNAIKFTERGSVVLRVDLIEQLNEQVKLRFSVTDTGIGIHPEQQAEIFEVFHRIDRTREGLGLGLFTSKHLVDLMGSQLNLDSRPGRGSRFWFDLELYQVTEATNGDRKLDASDSVAYRRLLVVDNGNENREHLWDILPSLGILVEQAADPEQALTIAYASPPDLILTDLAITRHCCYALMKALYDWAQRHRIPVIVLVNVETEDPEALLKKGVVDYLRKPISLFGLLETLDRHLNLNWQGGLTAQFEPPPLLELEAALELVQDEDWERLLEWSIDLASAESCFVPFMARLHLMAVKRHQRTVVEWLKRLI